MVRVRSARSLVAAGFVVWMAAAVPQIAAWTSGRAPFERSSVAWCVAYGSFAIAFLVAARARRGAAALAGQSLSALMALAFGNTGFEGALLCVVAGESPLVVGEKTGIAWVIAQTVAMVVVDLVSPYRHRAIHVSTFAYAGFQLFAFGASRLVVREAQARAELGRVHAELLATRELFADSTRTAERLRIARELHDALGHHLTALNLQLELARNIAEGQTKEPVDHAHALTKDLLVELRSVVSALREEVPLDLSSALQTLVAGIPHPRVHLEFDGDLAVDAALAHTIFRCVQEALTNALRHAQAENVFVSVRTKDETVAVSVRDDGRGASELTAGCGLSGLRERIEAMGGKMEVEAQPGLGLTLRALLPARAGAP